MTSLRFLTGLVVAILASMTAASGQQRAGLASADITPDLPIFLSGYGNRTNPATQVAQKIHAKALAIQWNQESPLLLMTVDNCGISHAMSEEIASRIGKKGGPARERIAIYSTHTHGGPCLSGVIENIFSRDFTEAEKIPIQKYTARMMDQLEKAGLEALSDLKPARVEWQEGLVRFARNRRPQSGPVDHALPTIKITDLTGKVRGIFVSYACHATTLGGEYNQVHGDWPTQARQFLEAEFPGSTALVAIGCGADANPSPRGQVTNVVIHSQSLAAEVKRLLAQPMRPLNGPIVARARQIQLDFDPHFTRAQWEERAKQSGIVGYHASKNLARLDRGEKLPVSIPYLIQVFDFGGAVTMINLPGEVVVDYSVRLKKELGADGTWVHGYANGVPCYIPSKRILNEGGYEAEGSLWYYDQPARLAPQNEDRIIQTVRDLLPGKKAAKLDQPDPKSPEESLLAFRLAAELEIKLAASEPAIDSPVAVDFGVDGKVWVVEMRDYPSGLDGRGKPGGRVSWLQDQDGDGFYEKSQVFVEDLPFPTGAMAWRQGVLICAAPDIIYAADTDGDGKADSRKVLFSHFATHNFQARVNGLRWGLDNWVYGASGLFGGKIAGKGGVDNEGGGSALVDLSGRDFRFLPGSGAIEGVGGLSQQGRVRDAFGNWFGCDNSTLIWHFPLEDRYSRRNPHVAPLESRLYPPGRHQPRYDANQLFPASLPLARFNDPTHQNRVTSACGIEIYRDDALGAEFQGNAFVCEPVHNLVHRLVLQRDGITFSASRAPSERDREFLVSTDHWFRPVEVRTGPDGALWVVDMHRFVVEHPKWIPEDRLKQLDVRAGAGRGRIYRVQRKGESQRNAPAVASLPEDKLLQALSHRNGTYRDLAHRQILEKPPREAGPRLEKLWAENDQPTIRSQILGVLGGLQEPSEELINQGLVAADPELVRQSLIAAENWLVQLKTNSDAGKIERISKRFEKLATHPQLFVRHQLALSAGALPAPQAATLLGLLLERDETNAWIRNAILSSSSSSAVLLLERLTPNLPAGTEPAVDGLVATILGGGKLNLVSQAWKAVFPSEVGNVQPWQLDALSRFAEVFKSKQEEMPSLDQRGKLPELLTLVRQRAGDSSQPEKFRVSAIRFLGAADRESFPLLHRLSWQDPSAAIQSSAWKSLEQFTSAEVSTRVLESWEKYSPAQRAEFVRLLLLRPVWTGPLLDAVAGGKILRAEIPLSTQQQLISEGRGGLQDQARALFSQGSLSRSELLKQYTEVDPAKGIPEKGALQFEANCSSCHAYRGRGHPVGPDLAAFRTKPVDDFLLAILHPNAAIEPRYVAYQVETSDGRSLHGIVQQETATSIVLVQGGGVRESLLRREIKEIKAGALSLMPEGLEAALNPTAMADLISWLKAGEPPGFGSASPAQLEQAVARFRALGGSSLTRVIESSENLSYASWLGRFPLHVCRLSDGVNQLRWEARPRVEKGKKIFRFPVAMGFRSQPPGRFRMKVDGQELFSFDVALADQTWQGSDGQSTLRYIAEQKNEEDSNGLLEVILEGAAGKEAKFEVTGTPVPSQRWFGVYSL